MSNPYSDTSYWRQVAEELREDSRCSECQGFDIPTSADQHQCQCPGAEEERRRQYAENRT